MELLIEYRNTFDEHYYSNYRCYSRYRTIGVSVMGQATLRDYGGGDPMRDWYCPSCGTYHHDGTEDGWCKVCDHKLTYRKRT